MGSPRGRLAPYNSNVVLSKVLADKQNEEGSAYQTPIRSSNASAREQFRDSQQNSAHNAKTDWKIAKNQLRTNLEAKSPNAPDTPSDTVRKPQIMEDLAAASRPSNSRYDAGRLRLQDYATS